MPPATVTLTRRELTAALAARQLLLTRARISPAEAIRRLTPLQGQHPPAPYIALAARLEGFTRAKLETEIGAGRVVKSTLMRNTLHLASADDYPAYAQLARQARLRTWRKQYAHLDEEAVVAELSAWFAEPRTNADVRERVGAYAGVEDTPWAPVMFARSLLALVQLPPAGHWDDPRRSQFVLDPRPLPSPEDASALVLARYLEAFGPASKRTRPRGRASPSATSPGTGWSSSGCATRAARSCSTCPAGRCRRATRSCPCACSPTGTRRCSPTPTASASSPPG